MRYNIKDEELIKKFPHFERLLDEHFELKDRLMKLDEFITSNVFFAKLSDIEKDLMVKQKDIMTELLEVLYKRIEIIRG